MRADCLPARYLCVPNFSEGRDETTVAALVSCIRSAGATVMDFSMDAGHNRAVIAFFGEAGDVEQAAIAAASEAVHKIDIRLHSGVHPRFGAIDVLPIIPLAGGSMESAIALSHVIAQRIGRELHLPVYLYEHSAMCPERVNLANVRKSAGLATPDYGPKGRHLTAGAAAVGARGPLVAYNVNLNAQDAAAALQIAADIRRARDGGGGMTGVKALGLAPEPGIVQVSTNITQPGVCRPREVFEFIKLEADRLGVGVQGSELIGVVSREHLSLDDERAMSFRGLKETQFIEYWLNGVGY